MSIGVAESIAAQKDFGLSRKLSTASQQHDVGSMPLPVMKTAGRGFAYVRTQPISFNGEQPTRYRGLRELILVVATKLSRA